MVPNVATFTIGSRRTGSGTLKLESAIEVGEFTWLGFTFQQKNLFHEIAYKAEMLSYT